MTDAQLTKFKDHLFNIVKAVAVSLCNRLLCLCSRINSRYRNWLSRNSSRNYIPSSKNQSTCKWYSTEALFEDTPSIVNKILADIRAQFYIFLENECLNGLGASNVTTAIWGIIPQFTTAFNATTIGANLKVPVPNYLDVARAMKLQAFTAPNNREYFKSFSNISTWLLSWGQLKKMLKNRPLMIEGLLGGEFVVVQIED